VSAPSATVAAPAIRPSAAPISPVLVAAR
jgi:hypothetical protein